MASRRRYDKQRYATDPVFREQLLACGRRWRAARRSELNELQRRRWHAKYRASARFRRYGLSEEGYNALLAQQHGRCPTCKQKFGVPCVDHCHSTGRVRGLLCHKCNLGIGYFNDDPNRTRAATVYLEHSMGVGVVNFSIILRCDVGRLKIGAGATRGVQRGACSPDRAVSDDDRSKRLNGIGKIRPSR